MHKPENQISDQTLLQNYMADGNSKWIGQLLERYTLLLFGVCMKYLRHEEQSKDAVQQVFLKALSEMGKYPIENIGGWLYQVCRNYCLTTLKTEKNYTDEEAIYNLSDDDTVSVQDLLAREQNIDRLKECIQELKEEQRVCIVAFYLQKQSYTQIAIDTGFSVKEVKSYLQNGKRNLRIKMES